MRKLSILLALIGCLAAKSAGGFEGEPRSPGRAHRGTAKPRLAAERQADANPKSATAAPPSGKQIFVRSANVALTYRPAHGSSPVTYAELWYTGDRAQTWNRWRDTAPQNGGKVIFEAPADGLYGFYLILHNDAGGSSQPPETGIAPQQWVCVDRTPPNVQVLEIRPDAHFLDSREVHIRWTASDENLLDRPCSLYFRSAQSPSYQLIAEALGPVSSFRWTVPAAVSGKIALKITARDRAGNRGECVLDSLAVDAATPAPAVARTIPSPQARLADSLSAVDRPDRAGARVVRVGDAPAQAMSGSAYPEPRPEVSPDAVAEARKRYDLGTWHRVRGENALALARYREALELDASLIQARNDLAGLLFVEGHHESAAKEFERLLRSDPKHRPALKSLALVQAAQGRYRSSSETLNKLLVLDEHDGEAWLYLGDVTMFMGDRSAAREYWTRAGSEATAPRDVRERAARRLAIYGAQAASIAAPSP